MLKSSVDGEINLKNCFGSVLFMPKEKKYFVLREVVIRYIRIKYMEELRQFKDVQYTSASKYCSMPCTYSSIRRTVIEEIYYV